MNCYAFVSEPIGRAYAELIDACCSIASYMLFVLQEPDRDTGQRIATQLEQLSRYQVKVVRSREWPGTKLLAYDAMVYWYRVEDGLPDELREIASSLFGWSQPEAPEDLAFLRKDGRSILVSIVHEREAFLMLTADEFAFFCERAPSVVAILVNEGPVPEPLESFSFVPP
jgi:hypothetical protein